MKVKRYGFDELRALCHEVRQRTDDGELGPGAGGHTEQEVSDFIASLQEAGAAFQKVAYYTLNGGRVELRVRTDAEMDKREKAERSALIAERAVIQFPTGGVAR